MGLLGDFFSKLGEAHDKAVNIDFNNDVAACKGDINKIAAVAKKYKGIDKIKKLVINNNVKETKNSREEMINMTEWQEQVIVERSELAEKIKKLEFFLDVKAFADLVPFERILIRQQLFLMKQYSEILSERIKNFSTCESATI